MSHVDNAIFMMKKGDMKENKNAKHLWIGGNQKYLSIRFLGCPA